MRLEKEIEKTRSEEERKKEEVKKIEREREKREEKEKKKLEEEKRIEKEKIKREEKEKKKGKNMLEEILREQRRQMKEM